jgi:nitrous oxidase accessory protein NosD
VFDECAAFFSSADVFEFSERAINSDQGLRLYQATDNKLWHNNFVDNSQQVYLYCTGSANIWDDCYPSGENYWSDYTGTDVNSDGIGDTHCTIEGSN